MSFQTIKKQTLSRISLLPNFTVTSDLTHKLEVY